MGRESIPIARVRKENPTSTPRYPTRGRIHMAMAMAMAISFQPGVVYISRIDLVVAQVLVVVVICDLVQFMSSFKKYAVYRQLEINSNCFLC